MLTVPFASSGSNLPGRGALNKTAEFHKIRAQKCGAVAQLGERLNGIQEVESSNLFGSTWEKPAESRVKRYLTAFVSAAV